MITLLALQESPSLAELVRQDAGLLARQGLQVVGILLLAVIALRMLRVVTRRIERVSDDGDPATLTVQEQRARTVGQLLNSVGVVAISLAAGLTILNLFIEIGPLLAGVGVAGLAISFGAQSLVKDVISGFFILMENQFSVGDVIQVEGATGVVERMTLRIVMVRDVNGVLHIIPNGGISRVSNLTRGWSRAVVDIGVAYTEDVDRVVKVIREVAADFWKDPEWRSRLVEEPVVWGIESMTDTAVNFRMAATTLPGKQWDVGREIRRRVKIRFDRDGIAIPFIYKTAHILDSPDTLAALTARPRPPAPGAGAP